MHNALALLHERVPGSLAVAYAVYCTGMFATNPVPVTAAAVKTSLTLTQVLSRAILANWMVCVGVWQAAAATCLPGKLLGVWFPICGFFAVGLE